MNEEIKKDPYKFVCDYAEEIYPFAGRKVFEVAALMPPSLILPDIPYRGKKIRSNINLLILANPGAGKSELAKLFSKVTYNPINYRSVTSAKLTAEIHKNPLFSLIVEDFATMSRDPILIKVIESIIGDEKRIQRATMKSDIDTPTDGIGMIAGTPENLSEYLSGGLIFRIVPKIILHNEEQHSKIGEIIAESICENGDFGVRESIIKSYYEDLFKIQLGEGEIDPIMGYNIPKEIKSDLYKKWDKYTIRINRELNTNFNWFRSLQESFRFLISHAFLNVYNRELKKEAGGNILSVNREDYEVALKLMKGDLVVKGKLLSLENFLKSISKMKSMDNISASIELKEEDRKLIELMKRKR